MEGFHVLYFDGGEYIGDIGVFARSYFVFYHLDGIQDYAPEESVFVSFDDGFNDHGGMPPRRKLSVKRRNLFIGA
jgi:hypothetical protein